MENWDADQRWRELTATASEVAMAKDLGPVALPDLSPRPDGRPREASPRAVQFAQALAFDDSWSRIGEARRRRGWVH